jgi:hypothetical protein
MVMTSTKKQTRKIATRTERNVALWRTKKQKLMHRILRFRPLLPFLLLLLVSYFSFTYFFHDFYWNNNSRVWTINSSNNGKTTLVKFPAQKNIRALEIELAGQTSATTLLYLGKTKNRVDWYITLKKGKTDFSNSIEWHSDSCYLTVQTQDEKPPNLTLTYRFIGKKQ